MSHIDKVKRREWHGKYFCRHPNPLPGEPHIYIRIFSWQFAISVLYSEPKRHDSKAYMQCNNWKTQLQSEIAYGSLEFVNSSRAAVNSSMTQESLNSVQQLRWHKTSL